MSLQNLWQFWAKKLDGNIFANYFLTAALGKTKILPMNSVRSVECQNLTTWWLVAMSGMICQEM